MPTSEATLLGPFPTSNTIAVLSHHLMLERRCGTMYRGSGTVRRGEKRKQVGWARHPRHTRPWRVCTTAHTADRQRVRYHPVYYHYATVSAVPAYSPSRGLRIPTQAAEK